MGRALTQTDLDQIAEEFSAAIRRGEKPSPGQFAQKYNTNSDELRELLASVAMIEGLKQSAASNDAAAALPEIEKLDDYTIVREIGRGGMGVVFEAMHQSLGRRCAIKVLATESVASDASLARFRIEARAAARLRHTNIVPVFGAGRADGLNYYVMDYICGVSLKEWMLLQSSPVQASAQTLGAGSDSTAAERAAQAWSDPSSATQNRAAASPDLIRRNELRLRPNTPEYFRWVAGLGATTADALGYAHQQGVLHRDIKPANLLVDRTGEVWVVDFGLAKLAENPSVTQTGDVVGTPQYMPPESFEGQYDARSEVYCLGLTLYELLAHRPAIAGKHAGETIRAASAGVLNTPRQFNRAVPKDLETIVLKSLRLSPSDRYQTASELRDDLHNFLSRRPIAARRVGPLERVVRWTGREPVIAGLLLATLLLVTALAGVSAIAYMRTRNALHVAQQATGQAQQALQIKTQALAETDAQRGRAERNLQLAIGALTSVMESIRSRSIEAEAEIFGELTDSTVANVSPQDAKLLQGLLEFFDELASSNSRELIVESATAAHHAGDIYMSLGQLDGAFRAYTEAVHRYEQLGRLRPEEIEFTIHLADLLNDLAVISSLRGQLSDASEFFEQAVSLLQAEQREVETADTRAQFQYARAHRIFASFGTHSGLDAIEAGRRPPKRQLENVGRLRTMLRRRFGAEPFVAGRAYARTLKDLQAVDIAIETMEALVALDPANEVYNAELARAFRTKAVVSSRSRSPAEAESAIVEATQILEEMLVSRPDSDAVRYELATTLISTEVQGVEQLPRAGRAHELAGELLASSPQLPRYMALMASSLENIAAVELKADKLKLAERRLLTAVRLYSDLLRASPELALYETRRALAYEKLAEIRLLDRNEEAAIDYLERAVRRLHGASRVSEPSSVARMQLQRLRKKLAQLRGQTAG